MLCAGTFTAPDAVDHFLRLDGWTKGLVWVNGVLLGRYSAIGPTRTLYVPGPLVRAGENGVIVLELQAAATARVRFVGAADLGPTES